MDLRDLDLNLLLVLDGLFEEQTLTRAAQRARLSPSTMSAALAKLRIALGDELFVRTNGVMQPTARALALRPVVAGILSTIRLEVLGQAAFDPARDTGTFTFSVSDIGELEFFPRLLQRFARDAPLAHLKTVVVGPHDLVSAMDAGTVDLAMGYFPDLVSSMMKQQLLFRASSVCIARRGHPTIGAAMTREQYVAARHVSVAQQGRSRDVFEAALMQEGIVRNVTLEVSHFVSVPLLVAESDLVATVPRPLAVRFAQLCDLIVLDLPFATPPIEVKQFWHKRFDGHPRVQWLRHVVAETSQNRPSLGRPS